MEGHGTERLKQGAGAEAIKGWRRFVLDRVLYFCLGLLFLAFVVTIRGDAFQRQVALYTILPSTLLVAAAAFWPGAPWRLRQAALIVGMSSAGVGAVLQGAFLVPNGFTVYLMLCVLISVLMGRKAAWLVWLVGMGCWLLIAAQYTSGVTAPPSGPTFDVTRFSNWVRVVGIYGAISAATVASVSYLMDHTVNAVGRGEALYDALTKESTERIAALEEQRQLEDKLRQAQKLEALGTLAGGVAHDFNNLLVIIINNAELATMEQLPDTVKRQLEEVRDAGLRAADLTRQLLAFGRRQVVERSRIDLNARITETVRMVRRLLPTSINLRVQLAEEPLFVWGAPIEIDQVVMNLCVNARDAMPEGGQLLVEVARVNRARGAGSLEAFVRLSVRDDGCGMDEATQERLFEPFFTTKSSGQGTGLGMSLVHGIIQEVQGSIDIDSRPGHGTRVDVYWPIKTTAPEEAPQEPVWTPRRGHETLLVVDDDRGVRNVIVRQLTRAGYQVIACENGKEALERFEQLDGQVDMVVTDAVMPIMGGRQLHRELTERYGELPFLICSGYAAQTVEASFFDKPTRAFLPKPFSAESLQTAVRKLLDANKPQEAGLVELDPLEA